MSTSSPHAHEPKPKAEATTPFPKAGADPVKEAATGAGVGAGIGAALWGMAMPAANFIGFGANGIAAGSTAASMMSSAAIANGGGVAAGSTVATLQSIGVVGLATPVGLGVVAAGVVVGGTIMGTRAYLSSKRAASDVEGEDEGPADGEGVKREAASENDDESEKSTASDPPAWLLLEWLNPMADPVQTRYTGESEAREAYGNSFTSKKMLFRPDLTVAQSSG